jgi:signal transduction histidine kinase
MVNPAVDEREELDHFVRALSHDMSANFMLLEDSFSRLKRSIDEPSPTDRVQLVAHVEACLRESKQYLHDLVTLAKTGRVAMEPSDVDAGAVLGEVLFEQRDLIQARRVKVNVPRRLPRVRCNSQRLKQVFTNLLRNAVLHGCDRRGPAVTISAKAVSRRSEPRLVALRIHDNGPGIEPRFHEEVFLPGRRLAKAAPEGSGMGLAIVKKTVEYYGGRVYVDPRCRNGTAIVFLLPHAVKHGCEEKTSREKRLAGKVGGRSLGTDSPHKRGELHAHQPLQPSCHPDPLR